MDSNTVEMTNIEHYEIKKNGTELDNFLQNINNKKIVEDILNNDTNLKKEFESFLTNLKGKQKLRLQKEIDNHLSLEDIKCIIIEHVYKLQGYKIGENIMDNNKFNKVENNTTEVENNTTEVENNTTEVENNTTEVENNMNESEIGIENNNRIQALNEAIAARQTLIQQHPELEEKTNQESELFKNTKSELEQNGVIQQLKNSNHDENFINTFILVQATLKEVKNNPIYKENEISRYEKIVKNLNNSCNIPDTKLNNFSKNNIEQTRKELFNDNIGNKNLIMQRGKNKESHAEIYEKLFENMDDTEIIKNYGKFIIDDNLKTIFDKYSNNKDSLSDDEYKQLLGSTKDIKQNMDENSKNLIEEMCILSQVKGMTMCIGKNFGDNFQFNKANEIKNENGVLTIKGNVNGLRFSFRHDTNDANARLQTSSQIVKNHENKFLIGENFEDSPFKLPTQGEVFQIALSCVDKSVLEQSSTPTEYTKFLQDNISDKMDILYSDTKFTDHFVTDKIKGEKICDKTIGLIESIKGGNIGSAIDQNNGRLFEFVDLINFNIKNSTTAEKNKIYNCMQKIDSLVAEYGKSDKDVGDNYPEIIKNYITDKDNIDNSRQIINGYPSDDETLFDLFEKYTKIDQLNDGKLKMINFDDLYRDLDGNGGNFSKIAKERQDEKDRSHAETKLEADLDKAFENM